MKQLKWIEKTLEQSLGRIVDCIVDYADSNVTNDDYTFYSRPISQILTSGSEGTQVSYPGMLESYDYMELKFEKAKEIVDIIHEKSLTSEFRELVLEARNGKEVDLKFHRFVRRTLREGVKTDQLISQAIDDVLERQINWRMRALVFGLKIEDSPLQLGNITLRNPIGEDFVADFIDWRMHDDFYEIPETVRWEPVHTIVEWKSKKIQKIRTIDSQLRQEVKQLIQDLRLCKTSRFVMTQWKANTDIAIIEPILYKEVIRQSVENAESVPSEQFNPDEVEKYIHLIDNVLSKVHSEKNLVERIERARNMYDLACERESIESILFSVIGLETLYSDSQQELRYKLAARTASLLGKVTGISEHVYESVLTAYEIRSKFVHGGSLTKYKVEDIKETASDLREILRSSIIIWLSGKYKKDEKAGSIREKIDRLPFSETALEEIDHFLEDVSV